MLALHFSPSADVCWLFLRFFPSVEALSWAQEKQERPARGSCSLVQPPAPPLPHPVAWAEGQTACTLLGGTGTSALRTTLEEKCCRDNAFPLIFTSWHPWATKCSVVLCFFTWNQFLKQTNYRKCLQRFSAAANIKHLTALLMNHTGIQSCSMLEGVTLTHAKMVLSESVQSKQGECNNAGSPARNCSLSEQGSLGIPQTGSLGVAQEMGQCGVYWLSCSCQHWDNSSSLSADPRNRVLAFHVLFAWHELWREARSIAQVASCELPLLLCNWVWICDMMSTSGSLFMWWRCIWSWQRAAATWGLKALQNVCAVLPYGNRRQCWSVWQDEAG